MFSDYPEWKRCCKHLKWFGINPEPKIAGKQSVKCLVPVIPGLGKYFQYLFRFTLKSFNNK